MRNSALFSLAVLAAGAAAPAFAGSPSAILTIQQFDTNGSVTNSWTENLADAGLLNYDSQNGNFVLRMGSAGETVSTDGNDYWAWQGDGWFWHSAQTAGGQNLTIEEQMAYINQEADPWAAVAKVTSLSGHGDPDLSYGYFAWNNTGSTQTYSFTVGETIVPPVDSPAAVNAEIGYVLTNPSGSLTIAPDGSESAIQQFLLSSDGGNTFTNAGVDVGPAVTTSSTGTTLWGTYSATNSAPVGSWNYMQITTTFTLTPGRDVASISGYAEIMPVPEPETYAMLLAGLGLLGFFARRRKAA